MSPTRYRLVVKGELGARYASAFEEMTISAHDGITEITEGSSTDHTSRGCSTDRRLGLTLAQPHPLDAENGEAARRPERLGPTVTTWRPTVGHADWLLPVRSGCEANAHSTSRVGEPIPALI